MINVFKILLVMCILTISNKYEAAELTQQDRRERCEALCFRCEEANEGPESQCMSFFKRCCKTNRGVVYPGCGCKLEIIGSYVK